MAVERDNDEERAAIVERLLEEQRGLHRRGHVRVSTGKPYGLERRQRPERRKFRSDAELRQQREELERQWNDKRRLRKPRKAS